MCVCVRACVCARAHGWAGTCAGGVRFSNSNRIIPSDYRILLLLKMPIPTMYIVYEFRNILNLETRLRTESDFIICDGRNVHI